MRLPAAVRHTRLHPGRDRLPLVQRRGRPRPSALARVRGFARENADFEILSLAGAGARPDHRISGITLHFGVGDDKQP
jgi:hypothetical protein